MATRLSDRSGASATRVVSVVRGSRARSRARAAGLPVLRPFFYLPSLYSSHDLFPVLTPRKRLLHATPLTTALWLRIRPLTLETFGCYAAPRCPPHPALPLHGRPSCLVLPWLLGCFWRGTTFRGGMARQLRISFSKRPSVMMMMNYIFFGKPAREKEERGERERERGRFCPLHHPPPTTPPGGFCAGARVVHMAVGVVFRRT